MTDALINHGTALQLGEEWIQAVLEKDFAHLSEICQPDVRSQLTTPSRVYTLENAPDLTRKVAQWFGEGDLIQKEQSRVALVGEKLAIFYRLSLHENGDLYTVEQQLYCTLVEGRIAQLHLLCSGFQPDEAPLQPTLLPAAKAPTAPKPDALLTVDTDQGSKSTCAILTPMIKSKLKEISSGQVLEVRVDDPSARGDIEAWCRLSGNTLLNLELMDGQELHFYLIKK